MTRWIVACWGVVLVACVAVAVLAGAERSPKWHTTRDAYVAQHPSCEACGAEGGVGVKANQVHHVKPVRLWPESELDAGNFITLCPRCHLLIGHLGDTDAHNPLAREDAARMLARVKARPYTREAAEKFQKQFSIAP